ncbi:MAG: hypothetical protein J6Y76_02875 [Paludibacteraceae bacterium]|jgi:chromosome segregation ATPase|nr:hypothetical protein [Paludibacteraceae bacterium]
MKKIFLSAVMMAAMVMGINADEYKHISPVTLKLVEFDLDGMRASCGDNLSQYVSQLENLQSDIERQDKDIAEAQKNLKAEKKLYDIQSDFLKGRKDMIKNEKKYYEGESKNYDTQLKNIQKQRTTIQNMKDVSSVAMQDQLNLLNNLEQDCNERKAHSAEMIEKITREDEKGLDDSYETLSQYLIELNDKTTRLENLAVQSKSQMAMVKAQIKNIKDQIKATAKK